MVWNNNSFSNKHRRKRRSIPIIIMAPAQASRTMAVDYVFCHVDSSCLDTNFCHVFPPCDGSVLVSLYCGVIDTRAGRWERVGVFTHRRISIYIQHSTCTVNVQLNFRIFQWSSHKFTMLQDNASTISEPSSSANLVPNTQIDDNESVISITGSSFLVPAPL